CARGRYSSWFAYW
nr:immunoglobulin heavy chain junction region [Mus musculus]